MSAASETSPRTGDSDATSEVVIRDHGRRVRIAPDDEKKSTGGETEEETPMVPENAARLDRRVGFQKPVSGREDWWRHSIKDSPNPGAYETVTFLEELDKRPNTYRFKSDGRKIDPQPFHKGDMLLPGAYENETLAQRLLKTIARYSFRDTTRSNCNVALLEKGKRTGLAPNSYMCENNLAISVDPYPTRQWTFRSESLRFPTPNFKPKDGPGPGNYEYRKRDNFTIIKSSFDSKTPRFRNAHTKVPGPGTYTKTFQSPQSATLAKMARESGIFFSSAFACDGPATN